MAPNEFQQITDGPTFSEIAESLFGGRIGDRNQVGFGCNSAQEQGFTSYTCIVQAVQRINGVETSWIIQGFVVSKTNQPFIAYYNVKEKKGEFKLIMQKKRWWHWLP